MEAAKPFLEERGFANGGGRPIPNDARAVLFKFLIDEIRKHNKTIPISLCLETVEMWALFSDELGVPMKPTKPSSFYCNCGPLCTPEHPLSRGVRPGPSWFGGERREWTRQSPMRPRGAPEDGGKPRSARSPDRAFVGGCGQETA